MREAAHRPAGSRRFCQGAAALVKEQKLALKHLLAKARIFAPRSQVRNSLFLIGDDRN